MDNKPENQGKTWFWRWFLDNQLVSGLLILSLLLINLILFFLVISLVTIIYFFFKFFQIKSL